jgi:CheY-like chemotaxis protein
MMVLTGIALSGRIAMIDSQKILIVEDDPTLAEMLVEFFHAAGYAVQSTGSGYEALNLAADDIPDIVVLDIHLPDISGFDVCRRLLEAHKTRTVPVIFLTELTDRIDRIQGLELGVFDYITKPFDVQELRLRVRNVLHRASPHSTENPVTLLPEGEPVREALANAGRECGVLVVSLKGLNTFRELYGFVASDDVLRVTCLMVKNAAGEIGGDSAFCGHIDEQTLLVIAPRSKRDAVETRIHQRAEQTLELFYPRDNRGQYARTRDRLRLAIGRLPDIFGQVENLLDLKNYAVPPV